MLKGPSSLLVALVFVTVGLSAWLLLGLRSVEPGGKQPDPWVVGPHPHPGGPRLPPRGRDPVVIDFPVIVGDPFPERPLHPVVLPPTDPEKYDRDLVQAAGADPADGPALLDLFRKRTPSTTEREKIEGLIGRFAEPSFTVRQKTSAEVLSLGGKAVWLLQKRIADRDPELRWRCQDCLRRINETERDTAFLGAAARLLAQLKPADSAQVLLAYLPYAVNAGVADEMRETLPAVAVRNGKVEAALVEALQSSDPQQRGIAAEALCRAGARDELPRVRKLLADSEPKVRLQAAIALTGARERDAVPVLIELLEKLPVERAWAAEGVLCQLGAGKTLPTASLGRTPEEQKKCRESWAAWWKEHGEMIDLAKVGELRPVRGNTMVALLDAGSVYETGPEGQVLWKLEGLQRPLDAQLLPRDRVLLAESEANRVSERNFKGEILWQKQIVQPLVAQRLPNGNTFIATQNQVMEVDRDGKEVYTHPMNGVRKAVKLPNGDVAAIITQGYVRMNSKWEVVHRFTAELRHYGGRLEVLPNGHVLLPQMHENKVVQFDTDGKVHWEAAADGVVAAVRLTNGNTLVASMNGTRAVELDRAGKEVWDIKTETRVTRAWRR